MIKKYYTSILIYFKSKTLNYYHQHTTNPVFTILILFKVDKFTILTHPLFVLPQLIYLCMMIFFFKVHFFMFLLSIKKIRSALCTKLNITDICTILNCEISYLQFFTEDNLSHIFIY
ncbi:hypothetical protein EDEG_02715 [Edhazardia aedis USNM 41457]|uniref:Uncharacterized protein n=1 Tax=Edhazardia aedis (strain USNM 41457) TaxID=1003232 RepID=J9D4Z6_EDHAE|nr:hypothetical protein EDEG_02715 [Edhazardia aedis USNM 41457]|eukprot:EJW02891.1 hypothetical protein EDEG_02715 [Edhazardia aedis USNM 41457]